jgi:dTDP-4-amino-4,6-dideoxygalactose transaminase
MDPDGLEKAIHAFMERDPGSHPLPHSPEPEKLRLRGIIAADLFGLPTDYGRINSIAARHGLFVIQDAAQSFGGGHGGVKACAMAEIGCTSFFPAKPLGGYGDGGMCFTENEDLASKLRSLRVHGQGSDKYENVRIGINGRLDTLQAAILLAKFEIFPEEVRLRQEVARCYEELLGVDSSPVVTPAIPDGYASAWAQYSVLAKEPALRSGLQARLKEAGIPTAIYYPKPLHLQTAFRPLGYRRGDFPVSETCAERIFSLPMHPYLQRDDQEKIAAALMGKDF